MIIQEWRSRKSDILPFALVLLGLIAFTVYAGWRDTFGSLLMAAVSLMLAITTVRSYIERDHLYLVVSLQEEVVREVVENVLQEKGLAYYHTAQGFDLPSEGLRLQIGRSFTGAKAFFVRGPRAYVSIGPVYDIEEPLIQSLQARIAEGLLPRGLHH
jgi:hypothetical protein